MKRTPEDDDAFVAQFAEELNLHYRRAKKREVTDQDFADSIGVKRAQLDRYLEGGPLPSLRTVALAYQNYGIAIPYAGIPISPVVGSSRPRRRKAKTEQLLLPFTLRAEGPRRVDVKIEPLSARTFQVRLTIKRQP